MGTIMATIHRGRVIIKAFWLSGCMNFTESTGMKQMGNLLRCYLTYIIRSILHQWRENWLSFQSLNKIGKWMPGKYREEVLGYSFRNVNRMRIHLYNMRMLTGCIQCDVNHTVSIEVERRTYPTGLILGLSASLFPQLSQVFPAGLLKTAATWVVAEAACSMKPTWNPLTTLTWLLDPLRAQIANAAAALESLSCVWIFATSWTAAHQIPLSMEFSRHESGLPFPSPGNLPDPGIELGSNFCNSRQILHHWATREAHSRGPIQALIQHHSQHWWAEGTSQPPSWLHMTFSILGRKAICPYRNRYIFWMQICLPCPRFFHQVTLDWQKWHIHTLFFNGGELHFTWK